MTFPGLFLIFEPLKSPWHPWGGVGQLFLVRMIPGSIGICVPNSVVARRSCRRGWGGGVQTGRHTHKGTLQLFIVEDHQRGPTTITPIFIGVRSLSLSTLSQRNAVGLMARKTSSSCLRVTPNVRHATFDCDAPKGTFQHFRASQ